MFSEMFYSVMSWWFWFISEYTKGGGTGKKEETKKWKGEY